MNIIFLIAICYGILFYRTRYYWRLVGYAYAFVCLVDVLFRGTETPGLITGIVIKATNDGPEVATMGIIVLVLTYGSLFVFYKKIKKVITDIRTNKINTQKVSKTRKIIELLMVVFLTYILIKVY